MAIHPFQQPGCIQTDWPDFNSRKSVIENCTEENLRPQAVMMGAASGCVSEVEDDCCATMCHIFRYMPTVASSAVIDGRDFCFLVGTFATELEEAPLDSDDDESSEDKSTLFASSSNATGHNSG